MGWTTTRSSINRRRFCARALCGAAALAAPSRLLRAADMTPDPPATPTRPDVAAIDRARILAAAERYLAQAPTPLTSLQCARSPGTVHDYYSEALPEIDPDAAPPPRSALPPPTPFTAHGDALFSFGLAVPALTAAYFLTGEERYAQHAALHLRVWFVDPATRMAPGMDLGSVLIQPPAGDAPAPHPAEDAGTVRTNSSFGAPPPAARGGRPEGILETLPLVEIAQAIPFLSASPALSDTDRKAVQAWFAAYLRWLTEPQDSGPRLAALARDRRDHHGTSWLLQVSAYSTLLAPETGGPRSEDGSLEALRHRYKTITLRAQTTFDGTFPRELQSSAPYRNSLFNLDMLAAICHLLSTRFESIWDYELEDGPGMRAAIAYHFPYIADRTKWPFRADAEHFDQLPGRRASLLLTARAYQRPEYAALWKTLPPDPASPEVLRTLPIHQPLLWVRQPPRPA